MLDEVKEVELRLSKLEYEYNQTEQILQLVENNIPAKDLQLRALSVFTHDWRAYAIRHTPLKGMHEKVSEICYRTMQELAPIIQKVTIEYKEVKEKGAKAAAQYLQAAELHKILDQFLNVNPNYFNGRELDCLMDLIDDGTIENEGQLAEYGVTLEN